MYNIIFIILNKGHLEINKIYDVDRHAKPPGKISDRFAVWSRSPTLGTCQVGPRFDIRKLHASEEYEVLRVRSAKKRSRIATFPT